MIGIVSSGGYIPRLRLQRSAITKAMGWFAPNLLGAAQGERSMCNWDEDTLTMAVASARDCIVDMDKSEIDAVYLASTTMPFADRDNAGILKTALNLKNNISTADFSTTLKAGTTALISGLESIKGGDRKEILVVAADKRRSKAASIQEMRFGDGAASLLLGRENLIAEFIDSYSVSYDFVDHYRGSSTTYDYNWEERWIRDEGYTKIYIEAILGLLEKASTKINDVAKIIYPCPVKRTHTSIAKSLGAKLEQVADNMHEVTGECGSAHPFVMLAQELENAQPGDKLIVAGFGQGADVLLFQVTDNIKNLNSKQIISKHLACKKAEHSYTKWLLFNELIDTEMGARAEADNRTPLSTLWREHKLILGFVGGICKECNTPQIPSDRVCVNPDCGAVDSQEEYEFSNRPARVLTFTGDNLGASMDPPAIFGMIQFEGGGRMLMDFSDCELDDVEVGVPMELSFRKKYYDKNRGFTGYFWKAIPQMITDNIAE